MVRVGFIVEGGTEKIVVESKQFKEWAHQFGIEVCSPVIDAEGGGNLLPHNIEPMIAQLQLSNPDHIVILTDLEYDPTPETVLERIGTGHTNLIFIAVKAFEAWFLADSIAMQKWLSVDNYFEERPEETVGMPWERIKEVAAQLGKRGPGGVKLGFAKKMVNKFGFNISSAATHPNCPSVKKFHDAFTGLSA